jgi:preprotein translocase subunit SecG
MVTFLIVLHVFICVLLIVTVLLQFGKGAETGAVMGMGASQAVFSSSAKGNFMTKTTTVLAIGFFINSIVLTTMKSKSANRSLFDSEAPVAAPLNSDAQDLAKKGVESVPAQDATATERGEVPGNNEQVPSSTTAPGQVSEKVPAKQATDAKKQ